MKGILHWYVSTDKAFQREPGLPLGVTSRSRSLSLSQPCLCYRIKGSLFSDWLGQAANEAKVMDWICAESVTLSWHVSDHKGARCDSSSAPAQGQLYCGEMMKTHTLRSPLNIMDIVELNPCRLNLLLKISAPGKDP